MGWMTPQLSKESYSRTFLSWLSPSKKYSHNTGYHGGERAFELHAEAGQGIRERDRSHNEEHPERGGDAGQGGFDAAIVEAHAIDDGLILHQPEQARLGIARLRARGEGADLDKAEAEAKAATMIGELRF